MYNLLEFLILTILNTAALINYRNMNHNSSLQCKKLIINYYKIFQITVLQVNGKQLENLASPHLVLNFVLYLPHPSGCILYTNTSYRLCLLCMPRLTGKCRQLIITNDKKSLHSYITTLAYNQLAMQLCSCCCSKIPSSHHYTNQQCIQLNYICISKLNILMLCKLVLMDSQLSLNVASLLIQRVEYSPPTQSSYGLMVMQQIC